MGADAAALWLGCAPGEIADPGDLTDDLVASGIPAGLTTVVGAVPGWRRFCGAEQTIDDLDWWLVAEMTTVEPAAITFDGLTFPATVFVDGVSVADVESMFLPVTVNVSAGVHRIAIRFGSLNHWLSQRRPRGRWRSSLTAAQGMRWARTTLLGRAPIYQGPVSPVGVWRPVRIRGGVGFDELTVSAVVDPAGVWAGGRCIDVAGQPVAGQTVHVVVIGPSGAVEADVAAVTGADGAFTAHVEVGDPELWWPNGYGDQPLYRVVMTVDGERTERTVGFRSLTTDRADDGFVVRVNEVPVFCRGAVWTPIDPTQPRAEKVCLRERLAALADAGATMVRVPGGLVYEQPEFWEACAELGLLIWQDAMVVTFDPPAELDVLVARELTTVLRDHGGNPSMAVVSGGSETVQQPVLLGLAPEGRGIHLIEDVLRDEADRLSVPYVTSSPSSPVGSGHFPLRADSGISHWFGVGGYRRPRADVRSADVRFAAEALAFAIPSTPAAVEEHFGSAAVAGHDPRWKAGVPRDRGSSWDFEDVRDFYVAEVIGADPVEVRARDPELYLQYGRIAVGQAMTDCYTHWRLDPRCGGALVLAASDLAPGAGWGLFDVDGNAKLPVAMLTRVWSSVAVLVTDEGLDGVGVHLINDSADELVGELRLTAASDRGDVVVEGVADVIVPARSSITLHDTEITGVFRDLSDAYRFGPRTADAVEVLFVGGGDGAERLRRRGVLVTRPGPPRLPVTVNAVVQQYDSGWELEVTSSVALRWVDVDVPGWTSADTAFHIAPTRPYRVPLTPDSPDRGVPRGRITTPDLAIPVSIEVQT